MITAQNTVSSLKVNDDPLQTRVNLFFKELQDLGVSEDGLKDIAEQLIVLTSEHFTAKISLLMDEEEFSKWQDFVDAGANTAQQALVLNKFLKEKINKDIDTINTEITESLMQNILASVRDNKELMLKISQLDDAQIKEALELLDKRDFDNLDVLLNIN